MPQLVWHKNGKGGNTPATPATPAAKNCTFEGKKRGRVGKMRDVEAFSQSQERTEANEARLAAIRNYLNAINTTENLPNVSSPMDHMPGAQPSLAHKLVPLLAQEVLSLHEEVAAQKKQVEELKGQSGHNR